MRRSFSGGVGSSAPRQAARCWRSPTGSSTSTPAPRRSRPCSTMTTSFSRPAICCCAPAPRPGCCSRSTAASTISSSTRRKTPTPSSGRSSSGWRRSSSPASARASRLRTLFAVGDEKQSIYSFQGADPVRFGAVGRAFRAKAFAAELTWHEVPLNVSFRSTEPVLKAVDAVFAGPPAADGLSFEGTGVIAHYPSRKGEAGRVELWEPETEAKTGCVAALRALGRGRRHDARSRGALPTHRQADHVLACQWRGAGLGREDGAPGDILILVRRRDPFTTPMIRALKRAGVPVAGADRMRLLAAARGAGPRLARRRHADAGGRSCRSPRC